MKQKKKKGKKILIQISLLQHKVIIEETRKRKEKRKAKTKTELEIKIWMRIKTCFQ